MRKVLFLFLFLAARLFPQVSSPSELVSLQGESSAIVYGCINALTGDFVLRQTDSVVKGAQPLYLPRYYISRESDNPNLRWQLLKHVFNGLVNHIKVYK